jgi:hypothetical protein
MNIIVKIQFLEKNKLCVYYDWLRCLDKMITSKMKAVYIYF